LSAGTRAVTGFDPAAFAAPEPRRLGELIVPADRERVGDAVHAAVVEKGSWDLEYRIVTAGGAQRWVWDRGHVVLSTEGEVLGLEGFITDVTERRELEEGLLRSQKMEALGELTGSIAHDFNNLLTAIITPIELLLDELDPSSRVGRHLAEVNETAYLAASLTQQLLAFCRKQAPIRRVLDVNHVVERLRPTLERIVGERCVLRIRGGDRTLAAFVDPSHLEQVIVNLVVNARDAQPHGGWVSIELGASVLAEGGPSLALKPGAYVTLTVEDAGVGMPPDVIERIFEPFFTTKEEGTGLGLATVYGIVTQHGGAVEVRSREGDGSTFTVYLPLIDAPVEDLSVPRERRPGLEGHGTVLLVEDDDRVRSALAEVLRRHGYRVLAAKDGRAARARVREVAGGVDVVVSDLALDDASGPELVASLREALPSARVVYVTGYASEEAWRRIENDPSATVLQKPFSLAQLLEAVAFEPGSEEGRRDDSPGALP
jgi:signal transduction histidine kinase/CheY-like chemotaxis protein